VMKGELLTILAGIQIEGENEQEVYRGFFIC